MLKTHLINSNGSVARDLALQQGERRENILYGSVTDEQRGRRVRARAAWSYHNFRAACREGRSERCYGVHYPDGVSGRIGVSVFRRRAATILRRTTSAEAR